VRVESAIDLSIPANSRTNEQAANVSRVRDVRLAFLALAAPVTINLAGRVMLLASFITVLLI
jgi:hypothetical protein